MPTARYCCLRFQRVVQRMAAKYLENAFSPSADLSRLLLVTSPLPFPPEFPRLTGFVLNDSAQCSAKEIPAFPSCLTRKLSGSQHFPGGGLIAHRERGSCTRGQGHQGHQGSLQHLQHLCLHMAHPQLTLPRQLNTIFKPHLLSDLFFTSNLVNF